MHVPSLIHRTVAMNQKIKESKVKLSNLQRSIWVFKILISLYCNDIDVYVSDENVLKTEHLFKTQKLFNCILIP